MRRAPVLLLACVAGCAWLGPADRSFPCRTDVDCVTGWRCGDSGFCVESGEAPDPGDPVCGLAPAGRKAFGNGSVLQFGSRRNDLVWDVVERSGGYAVVGDTEAAGVTDGTNDGFVAWLTAEGEVERCVRIASADPAATDSAVAVEAVPGSEDVVVLVTTTGDAEGAQTDSSDILVARYGPDGTRRFLVRLDFRASGRGPSRDLADGLVIDRAGWLWISGGTDGVMPGHPETPSESLVTGFVAVFDPSGAYLDGRLLPWRENGALVRQPGRYSDGVVFGAYSQVCVSGHEIPFDATCFDAVVARYDPATKLDFRVVGEVLADEPAGLAFNGLAVVAEGTEAWLSGSLSPPAVFAGHATQVSVDGFLARSNAGELDRRLLLPNDGDEALVSHLVFAGNRLVIAGLAADDGRVDGGTTREDATLWTLDRDAPATPVVLARLRGEDSEGVYGAQWVNGHLLVLGQTNSALGGPRRGGSDAFLWTLDPESP